MSEFNAVDSFAHELGHAYQDSTKIGLLLVHGAVLTGRPSFHH